MLNKNYAAFLALFLPNIQAFIKVRNFSNNDGWLDIFVSGYNWDGYKPLVYNSKPMVYNTKPMVYSIAAEHLGIPFKTNMPRLYRNNGKDKDGQVHFTDVSKQAGLHKILFAMGSNFGDLENDGYLDMYLGTGDPDLRSIIPNIMYRNAEGETFQEVTTTGGFGNIQKGHGVSFGDFDNDGDQDIYIVMGGAYTGDVYQNLLFENPYSQSVQANNWINLKLVGTKSNKQALGTRVKFTIDDNGNQREIYREVNSGGSFGGSPMRMEVGLGKANKIKNIQIIWHGSGLVQEFENIQVNQFIQVTEGLGVIIIREMDYSKQL